VEPFDSQGNIAPYTALHSNIGWDGKMFSGAADTQLHHHHHHHRAVQNNSMMQWGGYESTGQTVPPPQYMTALATPRLLTGRSQHSSQHWSYPDEAQSPYISMSTKGTGASFSSPPMGCATNVGQMDYLNSIKQEGGGGGIQYQQTPYTAVPAQKSSNVSSLGDSGLGLATVRGPREGFTTVRGPEGGGLVTALGSGGGLMSSSAHDFRQRPSNEAGSKATGNNCLNSMTKSTMPDAHHQEHMNIGFI